MPLFTVQDIVRATRGALVAGDLGVPVTGVSIDSRSLGVGEAFFAIRGHRLDGHAFLADAAGRGAACLVVHALRDDVPANVPLVLVEDTTKSLGLLATYHRARFAILSCWQLERSRHSIDSWGAPIMSESWMKCG